MQAGPDRDTVLELAAIATETRISSPSRRSLLLRRVAPAVIDQLPVLERPALQTLSDLTHLANRTAGDGRLALALWVDNALHMLGPAAPPRLVELAAELTQHRSWAPRIAEAEDPRSAAARRWRFLCDLLSSVIVLTPLEAAVLRGALRSIDGSGDVDAIPGDLGTCVGRVAAIERGVWNGDAAPEGPPEPVLSEVRGPLLGALLALARVCDWTRSTAPRVDDWDAPIESVRHRVERCDVIAPGIVRFTVSAACDADAGVGRSVVAIRFERVVQSWRRALTGVGVAVQRAPTIVVLEPQLQRLDAYQRSRAETFIRRAERALEPLRLLTRARAPHLPTRLLPLPGTTLARRFGLPMTLPLRCHLVWSTPGGAAVHHQVSPPGTILEIDPIALPTGRLNWSLQVDLVFRTTVASGEVWIVRPDRGCHPWDGAIDDLNAVVEEAWPDIIGGTATMSRRMRVRQILHDASEWHRSRGNASQVDACRAMLAMVGDTAELGGA